MSEILRCENLCKSYNKKSLALNHINLSLESGSITGLLGPNGAGKTTLIKLINGLLTPDDGEVLVCGKKPGVETKKLVSYLPDTPYLNDRMTVGRLLTFFTDFYADFRPELAGKLLRDLGIDPSQRLKTLSKGNKEKVCLILTMSRNARLYVLDEPIAGVDPATRDYVLRTILDNYNPEAAILISTHLIADVEQMLEDVIFLKNGEILLHKAVETIREENGTGVDELFREVYKW